MLGRADCRPVEKRPLAARSSMAREFNRADIKSEREESSWAEEREEERLDRPVFSLSFARRADMVWIVRVG